MSFSTLDIITIVAIVPLLIFSIFILIHRRKENISNLFLGSLLLVLGLFTLNFLLISHNKALPDSFEYFFHFGRSLYVLLGPLLYSYTKSVFGHYVKFSSESPHYLLFVVSLLYYFLVYPNIVETYYVIRYIQIFVYLILSFRIFISYRHRIENHLSQKFQAENSIYLIVLLIFFILWIIDVLALTNYFLFNFSQRVNAYLAYSSMSFTFALPYLIIYFSLRHKEGKEISVGESLSSNYDPNLTDEELDNYAKQINDHLKSHKPYLNPKLTLKDLSVSVGISPRLLSYIINSKLDMNFFNLINGLRIEEAKMALRKDVNQNILEICYNSGFNSKSAFNAAFKKFAGLTPSKFKENLRQ